MNLSGRVRADSDIHATKVRFRHTFVSSGNLMLLHETWACPFMEPIEFRTADEVESTRNHPSWNIVCDNRGSFIVDV